MSKSSTIDPGWVLYKDQLYHVAEFAHLPPKERPRATCPLCERPVVLKLGRVRAHHYAHARESDCAAGSPETALHLNTKFYLAEELERATRLPTIHLSIERDCSGLGCAAVRRQVWLKDWDEVQVEYRMDPFRPDIALLKAGKVVAALEILVTHAVDERKAAFFQESGVQWIEIRASELLYEGEGAWKIAKPLAVDSISSEVSNWICAKCQRRQAELEQHEAQQRQLQKEQQQRQRELKRKQEAEWAKQMEKLQKQRDHEAKNRTEVYCTKVVDHYSTQGQRQRETFYVERVFEDDQEVRCFVKTQGTKILYSSEGRLTKEILHQFYESAEQEHQSVESQGIIVDRFAPWRRKVQGDGSAKHDLLNLPFNLRWDREREVWVPQSTSDFRGSDPTCEFCGQRTSAWYYRDNRGFCGCNACLRSGKTKEKSRS